MKATAAGQSHPAAARRSNDSMGRTTFPGSGVGEGTGVSVGGKGEGVNVAVGGIGKEAAVDVGRITPPHFETLTQELCMLIKERRWQEARVAILKNR